MKEQTGSLAGCWSLETTLFSATAIPFCLRSYFGKRLNDTKIGFNLNLVKVRGCLDPRHSVECTLFLNKSALKTNSEVKTPYKTGWPRLSINPETAS